MIVSATDSRKKYGTLQMPVSYDLFDAFFELFVGREIILFTGHVE
jgi:hypothetical protein